MNCIFDNFNKKEATPFLQPNRNDPGKFIFPTTGTALAQAVQATSGSVFTFSQPQKDQPQKSLFTANQSSLFPAQQPQKSLFTANQSSLFPAQQPQKSLFTANQSSLFPAQQEPQKSLFTANQPSLFPAQQEPQKSLFTANQPSLFPAQQEPQKSLFTANQSSLFPAQQEPQKSLFTANQSSLFPAQKSLFTANQPSLFLAPQPQKPLTSVRLTKYTSNISTEKILALLSSEYYARDEDITAVTQLNPVWDTNDVLRVAPIAVAAFVDKNVIPFAQLPKIHVKFLQDLVQETVNTEEDVWKLVIDLATSHGLLNIVNYINMVRPHKTLSIQQQHITSEIAFVLAVHAFVTNNDRPHDVMTVSKQYSKDTAKLAADMCMANYGLSWILKMQTSDYINKHKNTYIISVP